MGRSRKPKKVDEPEMVEEVEEDEVPTKAPANKVPPIAKPQTHFTALLKQGITYEFEGMVFKRGIPKQVEMKYRKKFDTNGWFTITS